MKKRVWLIPLVIILAVCIIFGPGLAARYRAVKLVRDHLARPYGAADVMLTAERDLAGELSWLDTEQGRLWRLESGGVAVYYSGGVVYLENGKGYDFSGAVPELPENLWQMLPVIDVEAGAGEYRVTLEDLTLTLRETGEAEFVCFGLSGRLYMKNAPAMEPPAAVLAAMDSGAVQGGRDLTEDVLALMRGWMDLQRREPMGMELELKASLGTMELDQTAEILRSRIPGFEIWGLKTDLGTVYFGNGRLCSERGTLLAESEAVIWPEAILGLVYELCLNGELECGAGTYRLNLDEAGMRELLAAIVPQTRDMDLTPAVGVVTLTMEDGSISGVSIRCEAWLELWKTELDAAVRADITVLEDAQFPIPDVVADALA